MKKFSKIDTLSKLVKEGFDIDILLKFNNEQLYALKERVLNEANTTQSETTTYDLTKAVDEEKFKVDIASLGPNSNPEQADIDTESKTATITKELGEEDELTPTNVPVKKYIKGGKEVEVLEKEDLEEVIMDMGAGDFDDTSFYNPDAGGFDNSQGPMDSYYSTDNKGRFVRNGMEGDAGRYSRNADYLDTPSFNNPDARGFDSYGPTDSYGGNGWDEGGFAGEMNEYGAREVDPRPAYHFKSGGPRGHSSGLHEDAEDELVHVQKDVAGMDTDQDAPQKGPDNDDNSDDGMGMFERYITKKDLMEVAKSQSQYNFHKLVLACKKSKYTDCGDGRNDDAVRKAAKDMTIKAITDYTNTPNPENLPQKLTEQWLLNLVEKYERPSMTKSQFLQTLNEIAVATQDVEVIDNDVDDAKYELPSWLDFDSLFVNSPTTKPAPTKPGVKPGVKPGRRNPFKPKPGPKPRPKAITESECKIGDISELVKYLGLRENNSGKHEVNRQGVDINKVNTFLKNVGSNCVKELKEKFKEYAHDDSNNLFLSDGYLWKGHFTLQDALQNKLDPAQHLKLPKDFQSIKLSDVDKDGKIKAYTYETPKGKRYWYSSSKYKIPGGWFKWEDYSKHINKEFKNPKQPSNVGGTFGWG